jgi:hypothetical protein
MKHKLRKAAWGSGILLLALGLFIYVAHVRSKSPLEEYKAKLRADGEKLAIEDWIPPRVPADQNGAELLREAANLASASDSFVNDNLPPAMRTVAPGKAMIGFQQPDIRSDTGTNSWDQMDAALLARADELELLHKIIERPVLDFDLDYKQGFKLLFPNLAKTKASAQLLFAAATCDLHRGDTESAVTNTRAMLAIVHGMRDERLVISQLVRIAIAVIAMPPAWELLQSTNVTDEQLAALQKDWERLEFIAAAEASMEMERAMGLVTVAQVRASSDPMEIYGYGGGGSSGSSGSSGDWLEDLGQGVKDTWAGAKRQTAMTLWRVSWSYTDELRLLQGDLVLIETFRQLQTNHNFRVAREEQDRKLDALGLDKSGGMGWLFEKLDEGELTHLASSSVDALRSLFKRELTVDATKQLAISAIALKRFHLQNGHYPEELRTLVPKYLREVPRDPADGQPLRYHKNADGTFLLYSVGEDGVDDGGDPSPVKTSTSYSWQRGRDWVWPQPASEQEIKSYDANNSAHRR